MIILPCKSFENSAKRIILELILNRENIEIEIEKMRYKAIIESKPLHDPNNKNIKL